VLSLCALGRSRIDSRSLVPLSLPLRRITIGAETKYQGAREKHERAKAPKGGFVGMQPFKS